MNKIYITSFHINAILILQFNIIPSYIYHTGTQIGYKDTTIGYCYHYCYLLQLPTLQ